ncbi:hypothetical protein OG884_03655 [Streptosporangium sp. NBC_01755]|uniref:hypothetical protein n=1 Tax=unclassified Streptosporangium TaxID=2632669 RepID=UPI002DDA2F5D|nr:MULTISPECIES: hypothetical protein [unclassified Streptosporangium]WSA27484.1 hypothetical protein OIE13_06300 [Streptosporangium sp. NBC_01810]WSD01045.1 hypothetical protein OG884_03655 [Streptosporangium sp. NBC_01755]
MSARSNGARSQLEREAVATYSPRQAAELFALMIRRGAWQSPTLVTVQRFRRAPDDILNDPELRAPSATSPCGHAGRRMKPSADLPISA